MRNESAKPPGINTPKAARSEGGGQGATQRMPDTPDLFESAAQFQLLVPDAVLVGGAAAIFHADHRMSVDHDHVLVDLRDRYEMVLEALEREGEWVTNRVRAGKIILGQLGDIETRLRQLIRAHPLETEQVQLPSGAMLTVPTIEETLRIKSFLVVKRNQVRDYLDVAALAARMGIDRASEVLVQIDDYYADQQAGALSVASQVAAQLADPGPRDSRTVKDLSQYKGLKDRWRDWSAVVAICQQVATRMTEAGPR